MNNEEGDFTEFFKTVFCGGIGKIKIGDQKLFGILNQNVLSVKNIYIPHFTVEEYSVVHNIKHNHLTLVVYGAKIEFDSSIIIAPYGSYGSSIKVEVPHYEIISKYDSKSKKFEGKNKYLDSTFKIKSDVSVLRIPELIFEKAIGRVVKLILSKIIIGFINTNAVVKKDPPDEGAEGYPPDKTLNQLPKSKTPKEKKSQKKVKSKTVLKKNSAKKFLRKAKFSEVEKLKKENGKLKKELDSFRKENEKFSEKLIDESKEKMKFKLIKIENQELKKEVKKLKKRNGDLEKESITLSKELFNEKQKNLLMNLRKK